MHAIDHYAKRRVEVGRFRGFGIGLLLLFAMMLPTVSALAHGVDHDIERGEAVMVHFSSQHEGPMAGVGFRVFSPDGQKIFASGNTDALGRAVFVPNRPGNWRVLMATEDGHGAEVEVPVDGGPAVSRVGPVQDSNAPTAGRIPATAAGIGYLFGLAGLLALWRLRR